MNARALEGAPDRSFGLSPFQGWKVFRPLSSGGFSTG